MKLPTVTKWTAGDQTDASMLNEVSYALDFAMSPPEAWVVRNSTQLNVTPSATWISVPLTTTVIDTGAAVGDSPVWDSANPTRMTLWTPGWYDLEGNVHWASNTDGLRRMMAVAHNGTRRFRTDIVAKADMKQRVSGMWFLNAGDYLELQVWTTNVQLLAADPGQNSLRAGLKARWFSL